MKKLLVVLLALALAVIAVSCAENTNVEVPENDNTVVENEDASDVVEEENTEEVVVMSHDEYIAAELDSKVVVEAYVHGKQSWWDNKATVYAQDENGGYFFYEMACSEEDYAKLEVGTKIRVTGFKGEWAGEVEVMDATFEFVDGDKFVAEPTDVTALLGTEELVNHQNELVVFKGLRVVSVEYKNGEPGDDIYVKVADNNAEYDFCVERYLTGPETEVYQAVGELEADDVVEIEGFLYWYEGVNTHITSVTVVDAL